MIKQDLRFDNTDVSAFISSQQIQALEPRVKTAIKALHHGGSLGSQYLGWLNLPSKTTTQELQLIEEAAHLFDDCKFVVVIGIGGSYLGARAVIDALSNSFDAYRETSHPRVLYAGNSLNQDYLYELLDLLTDQAFGLINISKSGTTTEPAIAFRLLRNKLERQVGKEKAKRLIVTITDNERGALRTLSTQEGYRSFSIPDNIGGRFSVLTPVGLLPIAVAGIDIHQLIQGSRRMQELTDEGVAYAQNPSAQYAATRYALYKAGKKIEILGNYHPKLHYMGEWWKQLYGESEGKDGLGIFNAAVDFTTDLHSMGQWIQEGERSIFETIISVDTPQYALSIPHDKENLDGLNYLENLSVDKVNKKAEIGTRLAHMDGSVPNMRILMPALSPYHIGQLIFFFEKAVGISGYLLGINPFDQPGVEAYKNNMFALLNKPGYEEASKKINEQINK